MGGKKLEIHVKYFDPDGDMKNMRIDVPFITIWMSEKGIIIPANKALNNFLQEEHDELTKLSKKIIEILETKGDQFFEGIPEIYHPTIFMIKENDEGEHFRNAKTEFRKLALSEINDIIKVVEIDNELAETNTRLRKHLKRFALIGRIYLKIMDIGYYNLLKIFKTDDIYTSLSEILSKRLIRDGYWKIDIEELLKLTNLYALSRDLMKIKSDREKKRV